MDDECDCVTMYFYSQSEQLLSFLTVLKDSVLVH